MSTKLDEVFIEIKAKSDKLEKSFDRLQKDVTGLQSQARKTSSIFQNSFAKITAGALALAGVFRGVQKSVQAAFEQRVAEAKITQAIKSTGQAAGLTTKEIIELSKELQNLTGVGDEIQLQQVFAQLLTFTNIAGDNFRRTSKVALDLATVLEGDLRSASIQLGKALNDPVANLGALSRSGIQFSKEQKKVIKDLAESNRLAEAQALILDELEKQYGGQAKAAADAAGGYKQFNAALGDTVELIGEEIIPVLGPFAKLLTDANKEAQNSSLAFTTLGTIIRSLATAFAVVGGTVKTVASLIGSFVGVALSFFTRTGEAISAFISGDFERAAQAASNIISGTGAAIKQGFNIVKEDITGTADFITQLWEETDKKSSQAIVNLNNTIESGNQTTKSYQTTLKQLTETFNLLRQATLQPIFGKTFEEIKKVREEADKLNQMRSELGLTDLDQQRQPIGGMAEVPEINDLQVDVEATDILYQNLADSAQQAGNAMSSNLARAIIQGRSLNEVLSNTLGLFAQIALQSLITSAIGSVDGGGILGSLFSPSASIQSAGSNTTVQAISRATQAIQAQTVNQSANNSRPIIIQNNIDGKRFFTTTVQPNENRIQGNNVDVSSL